MITRRGFIGAVTAAVAAPFAAAGMVKKDPVEEMIEVVVEIERRDGWTVEDYGEMPGDMPETQPHVGVCAKQRR